MRAQIASLALEACDLLDSIDPEVRDGIGYEALERWICSDAVSGARDLEELRLRLMTCARRPR